MDDDETPKKASQVIGLLINDGRRSSKKPAYERLECLKSAERLLFSSEEESMLDNFLDEMLEFLNDDDGDIRSFTLLFIVSAIERDPEIVKKIVTPLSRFLHHDSKESSFIQKRAIVTCTRIYPFVLLWASQRRNDKEAEKYWKLFAHLKSRIMGLVESRNEGLRTMAIKFIETIIITQTQKTEFSERVTDKDIVDLSMVSRDHRFLSNRQLDAEAQHSFNMLLEQLSSSTITHQTLLTVVHVLCNVARQRPGFMQQVVGSLESLHINLPSTLATNQVKSLRKELRFYLLQMLRHPVNFSHHQRLTQLLTDLGSSAAEIQSNMPTPSEVSAALKKRAALASAAAASTTTERIQPLASTAATSQTEAAADKDVRLDDDEYVDEGTAEILRGASDKEDIVHASQRAIDITTDFVLDRLSLGVVIKLVTISLFTLPDDMPASFQSTYTDVHTAGSETQKRHLSRILAIQLTKEGEGPGIEHIRAEKQKQYLARQSARMEGAVIPPTPMHEMDARTSTLKAERMDDDAFMKPPEPKRSRLVQWDLFKQTKELIPAEARELSLLAYKRIMTNEGRANQGGASLAQQQLLIRLASRFHAKTNETLEDNLIEYIIADQKNRADLALLWLNELYAQYQGYSLFITNKGEPDQEIRRKRYDKVLCNMLGLLVNRNDIKETLFHRIFLEIPLITPEALTWLRKACLDTTFGGFSMSTLREMILTRPRQRNELLEMFASLSYHEPLVGRAAVYDVREQCVSIAKELYTIDHIRDDLRNYVISMSDQLVEASAPKSLVIHTQRLNETLAKELELAEEDVPWDEPLIRSALYLFLALLPTDHSLLHQLSSVAAKASNKVKRLLFRIIESAVKTVGMSSPELLDMIENCPEGAEPLVARVVHLLTERNMPSVELVERVRNLHKRRNTDVRSLLPIMTGLQHEELLELIPKFVMNATNSNSVPVFFRKLIAGRHIITREPLMSAKELFIELHRCKPANVREQGHLIQNIDQLIIDPDNSYNLPKEHIAGAIEDLIEEDALPKLLYQTLQKIHDHHPALRGFLSNLLHKAVQKHPDDEELKALVIKLAEKPKDQQSHPVPVLAM